MAPRFKLQFPYHYSTLRTHCDICQEKRGRTKRNPRHALSLLPCEGLLRIFLLLHNCFKGKPNTCQRANGKISLLDFQDICPGSAHCCENFYPMIFQSL
ncbi:hypothetical protein ACKS0A_02522 [Histoplasma ohiense]